MTQILGFIRIALYTGLLCAMAAFPVPVLGAEEGGPPPQLWLLYQEVVKPSRVADYEKEALKFREVATQHREVLPTFHYTALASDDLVYTYVMPISGFAALDTLFGEFMALEKAIGPEKWREMMAAGGATVEYTKEWVVLEDPELSYEPAKPRLKPEERTYFHYEFFYVQPGKEPEADTIAKEWKALFQRKNVDSGYRLYKSVMGAEMPLYVVAIPAKDAVDYWTYDQKLTELLGDVSDLEARTLAITRRVETKSARLRPDLSLPPAESPPGQ